jgi:predicted DNA-binding transcriptional regulator YafY
MRPYCIDTDKVTAHNYLVGYTRDSEDNEKLGVFRLSRILNIESDGTGGLSELEVDSIKDAIKARGVPFLREAPQIVKIRLTNAGQKLYSRVIHNRPIYDRKDGDTYVFNCTLAQIEYYFFKFGADAEVIEPGALREKFIAMHKAALERYSQQK